jgi:hypothetical protein
MASGVERDRIVLQVLILLPGVLNRSVESFPEAIPPILCRDDHLFLPILNLIFAVRLSLYRVLVVFIETLCYLVYPSLSSPEILRWSLSLTI